MLFQAILFLTAIGAALFDSNRCLAQQVERKGQSTIVAPATDKRFPNLGELKTRLTKYHDCQLNEKRSGCYEKDLSAVIIRAREYLQRHLKSGRKQAIVLDIDETSLSNWEEIKDDDFGYKPRKWNDWIESAKAPAIAPTLELFNFAKQHGIAVFFITGRRESSREATERNLKTAGYAGWQGLILRPQSDTPCAEYADAKERSEVVCYKATARKRISVDGYRIVINLGDQMSDLRGGHAERAFKLPNPFYFIP